MEDSIFTKIVKGKISGEVIYEDNKAAVILTVEPFTPGHMLVLPKVQVDHLWDVEPSTYHHLWDVAKQMADRLKKTYHYERVGVVVEGFGVPHAHIHVFGYEQPLNPTIIDHVAHGTIASAQELAEVAEKLRS